MTEFWWGFTCGFATVVIIEAVVVGALYFFLRDLRITG